MDSQPPANAKPTTSPEPIHWRSISAAIASISAVGIALGLGLPLLSVVLEKNDVSATMIGLNSAMAGLASIAVAPYCTPVAKRFGVADTMLAAIAVAAISAIGFYLAPQFWVWFPLRVTFHGAITVLFILSEFWINTAAPPARRGMVLGVYATVLSLGFALGPMLFSVLGSDGFVPFLVGALIILAAAIPVMTARRESPAIADRPSGPFFRFVFLIPTATAAVFVFGAVESGGFALFPIYASRIGMSETDGALLLSMIGLGNVLFQIPIGILSDHVRDRRSLLFIFAVIGLLGCLLLPSLTSSWWLLACTLFVWGAVVAGLYTVGLAHLGSKLVSADLAAANAAFVFCYAIGMLIGPQLIGISMDWIGPSGFAYSMTLFFMLYIALTIGRIFFRPASS